MPNPYTGTDNDPISAAQHQFLGKDWEKYFVMLNQATGGRLPRMGAQGPGAPVSLAGPGRTNGVFANGEQIGDAESARSNAINAYLSDLTDQNKLKHQADLDMAAHNQAVDAQSAARQSADRAMAIANDPRTSAFGAPIVGGNGTYQTGQPVGQPPPNRQALAAQMAPGVIAPPAPPAPVTFGAPVKATVNGKATFIRPGSDGQAYDMSRKPIPSESITTPEESAVPAVSPEGIELAAHNYLTTGVMPPLGMGDKGTRQAILSKAAELGGAGANVAANKADYKADSGSLSTLQKQRDTIGAFEETAGKNIDLFLDTAGKVVDTGSPLANAPLRAISGKLLGSPDQAAFDAARQVAVNEIAKITSNPNLTGQLSDSARHEVEAFNPREATLAQSVAVMRLLKQDMGNRVTSLDDAIKNVKGRIRPDAKDDAPSGGGAKKVIRYDMNGNPIK